MSRTALLIALLIISWMREMKRNKMKYLLFYLINTFSIPPTPSQVLGPQP